MAPGVLTDSGSWFTNFPSQSPGFLVAQHGYDVWTMNTWEITDRSHHKTLSQNDDRYWQWSFDEIGRYDIAAVIDLVLNVTGARKVSMLTFSQGWSGTLVLLSTRPEYNDKVDLILVYGPVANLSHVGYPLCELIPFADPLFLLLDPLRGSDYFYLPDTPKSVILFVCTILQGQPCNFIVFLTAFVSPEQLNKTRSPVGLAHYVHGTSYQNLRHFVQVNRAKDFLMYDHGTCENRKRYGQDDPPAYDVDRVTTKVALFSSQGDMVADPEDVSLLVERLGSNLLFHYVVEPKDFRHLDFCWGYRANDIVHNLMLDTLEKYSGTST